MDLTHDAGTYARGLAIGFAIAAAIGPIGLLCIRRTLERGPLAGLATGLGAATADGIYAGIAAFGLTALSDLLTSYHRPLGVAGGVVLVVLAIRGLRARPPIEREAPEARAAIGLPLAYVSTLGLTLTNPATILSFAAAFVGLGLTTTSAPVALTAGVFSGSTAWWLLLAGSTAVVRRRIGPVALRRLSVGSAVLIATLGSVAVLGSLAGAV